METTSASIDSFVERLVDEKGLLGLDDEVLEQVKHDLSSRVEDRINAAILLHIPDSKLEAFSAVLEKEDASEIQKFCAATIPGLDDVVAKELLAFRETYLGG